MAKQTTVKQRTRTITVDVCGMCNGDCETHCVRCAECGMAVCRTCEPKLKEYPKHVFLSGDSVYYCLSCLTKLQQNPTTAFLALQDVQLLRREYSRWRDDFDKRTETVEHRVRSLL